MITDPFLPLVMATDHYNISREDFIAKVDKVWQADAIFRTQALAHYDQIQKDMAEYERLVNNAI